MSAATPTLTPAPTTTDTSDARCWADDGLATHVLVHGECVTPLCAKHADWTADRIARYPNARPDCRVCGARDVYVRELHIYPI